MPAMPIIRLSDSEKLALAARVLAASIDEFPLGNGTLSAYAPCPGASQHTGPTAHRDFQLLPNGCAHARCFHGSCAGEVAAFIEKWRAEIWAEEKFRTFGDKTNRPDKLTYKKKAPKAPVAERAKTRSPIDRDLLRNCIGTLRLSREWVKRRSPIPVAGITQAEFLNALFRPGDRILIFTSYTSQGDFLYQVPSPERPGGLCRLSRQRNVQAIPSEVWPKGGEKGVWFLCAPVTGKWERGLTPDRDGNVKYTRRSEINLTDFPYVLLESDTIPEDEWLALMAKLSLPIHAIYTSGGKSIHSLIRVGAQNSSHFTQIRTLMEQTMTRLGACAGSLSIVRLTRLPGCFRAENKAWQELLYLDPKGTTRTKPLIQVLPRSTAKHE